MEERKFTVCFQIEVDACDRAEAIELAREGVILDYADVYIDSEL